MSRSRATTALSAAREAVKTRPNLNTEPEVFARSYGIPIADACMILNAEKRVRERRG